MKGGTLRKVRVYYAHRKKEYSRYPVIRLGGNYLALAGFNIGDRLEAICYKGRIVISKRLAD